MADFSELTDISSDDFAEAMRIYRQAFPANERHGEEVIARRVAERTYRMVVGRFEGKVVLMAILWPMGQTEFVLIDYVATAEEARGRGIGTEFFRSLFALPGLAGKCVLLEVEDPEFGCNREERLRRIAFYRRMGARVLEDVNYLLPPLSGETPTEMKLMMLSEQSMDRIAGDRVRRAITRIYGELHHRSTDDPLLTSFIHMVPAVVKLI